MGSELCSYEWAANRLGRSKRSIHNYIKKGFLRPVRHGGEPQLHFAEVEQLALELGTDFPSVSRATFFQIQTELKKLRDEMEAVKHMLEIRDESLRPSPIEAKGLIEAARDSLGRKKWRAEEIFIWAQQFEKMDEVSLTMLAKADPLNHEPWKIFYALCLEMLTTVSTQHGLESQALAKRLEAGRQRMRGTVLLWVELGNGGVPETVFGDLDTPKEKVLRRASRRENSPRR